MVRGNWQRRVEKTGARRAVAKQRKQKRDNRSVYKAMVQNDLWMFLDRHSDAMHNQADATWQIHIWTDTMPNDYPNIFVNDNDDNHGHDHREGASGGGKRRNRSGSTGNEPRNKGRNRSNSINNESSSSSSNNNKKKAHPRSKDSSEVMEDGTNEPLLMCKNQFYKGKCEALRNKKGASACRLQHFSGKQRLTLWQVLTSNKADTAHSKDVLMAAQTALLESEDGGMVVDSNSNSEGGVMMLYHSVMAFPTANKDKNYEDNDDDSDNNNNDPVQSIGDSIAKALSERACGLATVVYLAINNVLLFDRYRGGLILSDVSVPPSLVGESRRMRGISMASEGSHSLQAEDELSVDLLTGPLLEMILTFLPDESVAAMSCCCHGWYQEIGTSSPELWRHLLQRRKWPVPSVSSLSDTDRTPRGVLRGCFITHYEAVRDLRALSLGVSALLTRKAAEEREMVYQDFASRRFAPQSPNGCIAMEVWSTRQILAAYSHDCSIRLFQAVQKGTSSVNETTSHHNNNNNNNTGSANSNTAVLRSCREMVSVCVDPFRKTKKKQCQLVAMALDEEYVGCLCHVQADADDDNAPGTGGADGENFVLTVITRNDFLCAGGSNASDSVGWVDLEDGVLNNIDVREAVVNYLLSCDDVDHRMLRLLDFFADGGDPSEVEVLVSQSIAACGYGRFLLEVSVAIPDYALDDDNETEETTMTLLDRKLMIFSSSATAIVWMGDSNPTDGVMDRRHDLSLSAVRYSGTAGASTESNVGTNPTVSSGRIGCSVVAVSPTAPMVFQTELEPNGVIQSVRQQPAAELVRTELLREGDWQIQTRQHRPTVICQKELVVVDTLSRQIDDNNWQFRSYVSFYPRFEPTDTDFATMLLKGHCEVVRMGLIRNEHVLILARVYEGDTPEGGDTEENAVDMAANLAGEWFGSVGEPSVYGILVHVPTRSEIHRICLVDSALDYTRSYDIPIFCASLGNTIGVGVWWKGVVITGSDVREQPELLSGTASEPLASPKNAKNSKKKKKKRQPNRGGKKDGFARGMSMRG